MLLVDAGPLDERHWDHPFLYASLVSAFTIKEPLPADITKAKRWSIDGYEKDECLGTIPLLMLPPSGKNKSTINLHWLGLFLGIIPIGLS